MLYIHAGRGKTGTTAIQRALELSRAQLAAANISMPESHKQSGHHTGIYSELKGLVPPGPLQTLSALLKNDDATALISSEFLFSLPEEALTRLQATAMGHKVVVLIYLRDYPSWIVSLYSQATKYARNKESFDDFLVQRRNGVSALHDIARWVSVFGADNIKIHFVDGGLVAGVPLLDHFGTLLGTPLSDPGHVNDSYHWWATELERAVGGALEMQTLRRAVRHMNIIAKKQGAEKTPYLTAQQADDLCALFERDHKALRELCNCPPALYYTRSYKTRAATSPPPSIRDIPHSAISRLVEKTSDEDRQPLRAALCKMQIASI